MQMYLSAISAARRASRDLHEGTKERKGIQETELETEGPKQLAGSVRRETYKVHARKGVGGRLIASCGVSGLS